MEFFTVPDISGELGGEAVKFICRLIMASTRSCHHHHHLLFCFNGRFPGKPRPASSPSIFLPSVLEQNLRDYLSWVHGSLQAGCPALPVIQPTVSEH